MAKNVESAYEARVPPGWSLSQTLHPDVLMSTGDQVLCWVSPFDGLAFHPGGSRIFLVNSCCINWDIKFSVHTVYTLLKLNYRDVE